MTAVRLSLLAVEDLDLMVVTHSLPAETRERVARSLRALERFPLIGRELEGRWSGTRLLIGPWPWMLIIYSYDDATDLVTVLSIHDARTSTAATSGG